MPMEKFWIFIWKFGSLAVEKFRNSLSRVLEVGILMELV